MNNPPSAILSIKPYVKLHPSIHPLQFQYTSTFLHWSMNSEGGGGLGQAEWNQWFSLIRNCLVSINRESFNLHLSFSFLFQSLSILFHYLIQPISLAFCGHLGPHQLAAVAMAISVSLKQMHFGFKYPITCIIS